MKIKKFLNNSKAISPIFATLILIAIAVIAGVVVYMFTSGTLATMTGGGTAAQEKVAIQAVAGTVSAATPFTQTIKIYAISTEATVPIDSVIIKNQAGTVLQVIPKTTVLNAESPAASRILTSLTTLTVTGITAGTMTVDSTYTVTIVTAAGGSFPSQSFKATSVA